MPQTVYGTASDYGGVVGDDFDRLCDSAGAQDSISCAVSNTGGVEDNYLACTSANFEEPAVGEWTCVLEISATDSEMWVRARAQRYNSGGTLQQSGTWTSQQNINGTGEFTFTMSSVDLGVWADTDTAAIHLEFDGQGDHGNATCTVEMDVAANNETRFTMPDGGSPSILPSARRANLVRNPNFRR